MNNIRLLTALSFFFFSGLALAHPAHESSAMDHFFHSFQDIDHLMATLQHSLLARVVMAAIIAVSGYFLVRTARKAKSL